MRRVPALIVSAGLLITALTACSSGPASSDCPQSGDASALIDVSGDFGTEPVVDFPTPIKSKATQTTTIVEGDGPTVGIDDSIIGASLVAYDGATGEALPSVTWGDPQLTQLPPSVMEAFVCQKQGSRVAAVIANSEELGLAKGDTLIVVADIDTVVPNRATGADRPIVEPGFPSVVTAVDGTPGLTIPKSDPPKDLKVATLKQGDGPTVKKDDTLVVQYSAALWKEQRVFDSTWSQGAAPKAFPLEGNLEGLTKALTGKQVGSQVLVVIPPDLAYGDQGSQTVPPGATLIYVVDILAIV